jgi:uncharacterized protein YbjT (DUF2867 family)
MSKVVCVIGATGKQGGSVVKALQKKGGFKIKCLVRNPESAAGVALAAKGVELVQGDFNDKASLATAFSGVDAVFLMTLPSTFDKKGCEVETQQGLLAVEALKTAAVPFTLYSSCGSAHRNSGVPHFDSKGVVEKALLATGLPNFLLRPTAFFENLDSKANQNEWTEGSLSFLTAGDCKVNFVSTEDIGEVAAIVLADPDKYKGKTIELSGEKISGNEMAVKLSAIRGAPWKYSAAPLWLVGLFAPEAATMAKWFHSTGFLNEVEESRKIYPGISDFESYVRKNGLDKKQFKVASSCSIM